ncbi:MAG: hypothetical protein JSV56_13450 [Methanomassiliicoccales archaeon]|nr:MAG: hypothetical protein JSV56_13450 [Methanomassiliicoccales archaeon]
MIYMKSHHTIKKIIVIAVIDLILFTSLFGLFTSPTKADEPGRISLLSETLPSNRFITSAVWDGENAYIFGGVSDQNGSYPEFAVVLDEIVRFNPKTKKIKIMNATLSKPRASTSAVWSGKYAYILGGELMDEMGRQLFDEVIMYEIETDRSWNVTFMNLPMENYGASAVYDGQNVFIFGGSGFSPQDQIVQFNTSIYYAVHLDVTLPADITRSSAVWDGESVYIFGGSGSDEDYDYKQILRFTPYENTVEVMKTKLPGSRIRTSAVWDGQYAYVFGGSYWENEEWKYSDEILRYDPKEDKLTIMPERLPSGREGTSAVWTGNATYIFGGFVGNNILSDEIVEYIHPKEGDSDDSSEDNRLLIGVGIAAIFLIAISVFIYFRKIRS